MEDGGHIATCLAFGGGRGERLFLQEMNFHLKSQFSMTASPCGFCGGDSLSVPQSGK